MKQSIIYDNRKFTLGTTGRYFFARVKGKSESLHRYKYKKEKSEIPDGFHIHHKDGNCFNNEIDNLEAINPSAHSKLHPPSEEVLKKWQKAGIEAAPIWHASKEGSEWHKEHYDKVKNKLHKKQKRPCSFCGKQTKTTRKTGNVFCSNNCKSAFRRKYNQDYKRVVCLTCGKVFTTLKYRPNKYCSSDCKPAPNPWGQKGKPQS